MRIHHENGIVLIGSEHVLGWFKEYVKKLYDKENKPSEEENPLEEFVENMEGPLLLVNEFETALAELKAKKAEGPDGIPGELLVIRINRETRIVCNMQSNI